MEIWKKIDGFPSYDISNHGSVKSYKYLEPRILKASKDGDGYYMVSLCKNNTKKTCKIHKLVLEAFVKTKPEGMQCCHNDGNRLNNHISNLRWDTGKANYEDRIKHGDNPIGENSGNVKLTEEKVLEIRCLYESGVSRKQLRKDFDTSPHNIFRIIHRETWKHI